MIKSTKSIHIHFVFRMEIFYNSVCPYVIVSVYLYVCVFWLIRLIDSPISTDRIDSCFYMSKTAQWSYHNCGIKFWGSPSSLVEGLTSPGLESWVSAITWIQNELHWLISINVEQKNVHFIQFLTIWQEEQIRST